MDTTYTHVAPKENADSEVDYIAVVLYKPLLMATGHHAVIECHFVVIPSLKEHRKYVLAQYRGWLKDGLALKVIFNSDAPYIRLDQQRQVLGSYRIQPLQVPNEISWDAIRHYNPGRCVPHLAFELELLPGETPHRLLHKVNISGVTSPDYFYIRYPQPEDNIVGKLEKWMVSTSDDPSSASLTSNVQNVQVQQTSTEPLSQTAILQHETPAVSQTETARNQQTSALVTGRIATSVEYVEELLSELVTVQFNYQETNQQYIKVKDDYGALQEKVCILKADYEREKEELRQNVSLMTTRKSELFEALEQTEKTCNAKDELISKLENELMQCSLLSVDKAVQADYQAVAPDFLRGVDVFAETVLEVVGDKPAQKLEWPGYGFFIEVPEGALPPGVTASVAVKVILGGPFQFPENRQLISALYWVFSSELFLKEVAVNIQHCAVIKNEEQCSTLKFIIAKCSQEILPYRFREREGVFNPHTQYGTIKLKQFSIIGETAPDNEKIHHTALMLYKQRSPSPNLSVNFHLVVVMNLGPFYQEVERKYRGWSLEDYSFEVIFTDAAIELDQQEEEVDHWKIVPLTPPPKITKDSVRSFQNGRRIPHCPFMLKLLIPGKDFQELLHKVKLKGVPHPDSFFICYPQPDENIIKAVDSPVDIHSLPALITTQSQQEQAIAENPLWNQPISDEAHLARIAARIDEWREISSFLKLTAADESAILGKAPHSVPTQRTTMLRKWQQKQGENATYKQLREVFEQCERADLVKVVKQLVAGLSEENSAEPGAPPHPSTSSLPTTTATHEPVTQQEQQAATEMSLEESPEMSELMTAQEKNSTTGAGEISASWHT